MLLLLLAMVAGQTEIGPRECTRPAPDDMRPYTLCLAETGHAEMERRLQRQLRIAHERVRSRGAKAASRLKMEQRRWDRRRHRACTVEAGQAPGPEQARAEFACLDQAAYLRMARLVAVAKGG